MTKPKPLKTDFRPHDKLLLLSFILGPMAVVTNVTVSYFLAPESCMQHSKKILHLSWLAFLTIAIAGIVMARISGSRAVAASTDALRERAQWLMTAAIVLGIASVVALIATALPNIILRSCD
jgi:hypothetical protein